MIPLDRRTFAQSLASSMLIATSARAAETEAAGSKKPIRVGMIGTAHSHAAGKFAAMRELPEHFEIVGLVEPEETRRGKLDAQNVYRNVPRLTEQELFAVPGLQAVVVETAVRDLVATGQRVVDAGFALHLEKPAGESLPAFEKLLDTAAAKKLHVQLGYMLRGNPGVRFAQKLIQAGALGEIFEIEASFGKIVGLAERKELAEFRGGGMFELGCHPIDAVTTIMGQPERVTAFNRSSGAAPADLADNQLAILEYPHAMATIKVAVIDPQGGPRRKLTFHGSNGMLELQPLESNAPKLTLVKAFGEYPKGTSTPTLEKSRGRYTAQMQDFAEVVRGEHPTEWSYEHDLKTHRVVLQASGYKISEK